MFTPKSFAAGCVAGSIGQFVGHPLDTIKIHSQAGKGGRLPWRTLLRGVAFPVASAGIIQAVNLGLYENFRRRALAATLADGVTPPCDPMATPLRLVGASAASAGICVSVLTSPQHRVKVVQQLHGGSFASTAVALWRDGTLYRGFGAQVLFEASRGGYMMAYVGMKRVIADHLDSSDNGTSCERSLPLWARVVASSCANVLTWSVIYPLDVCKSVLQGAASETGGRTCAASSSASDLGARARPQLLGLMACAQALWAEGGVRRLYRGFSFTLLRAGPVAAIILPIFDVTLAALESST